MSRKPFLVLALSVVGISFAGPLVRLSAADPVAIAVWRLGFSLVIVAAFLAASGEWREFRGITRGELGLAGGVRDSPALQFWALNAAVRLPAHSAAVTPAHSPPS